LRAAYDLWVLIDRPISELAADSGQTPPAFARELAHSVQRASGGVKFGSSLTVSLGMTTAGPAEAQSLAGALRLLTSMASTSQQARPAADILRDLDLRADGNTVRLALSIPQDKLAEAVRATVHQTAQKIAGDTAPVAKPAAAPAGDIVIHSSPSDMGVVKLPSPAK
jgi:hypothetical protein